MSFATIIKKTLTSSWDRQRSTPELRSFIDTLHSRVEDVELDIAL